MILSSDLEYQIQRCYIDMTATENNNYDDITKEKIVLEFKALMLSHIKELFDKAIKYDDSNIAYMKREGFVRALKEYLSIEKDFVKYPLAQL